MQEVRRVEIIIGTLQVEEVSRVLTAHHVEGWTILPSIAGQGHRGKRSGDEVSRAFENVCFITTCEPERVGDLVDALRPILQRFGGLCLISEAHLVRH
jgi:nitrogen regulatory protein PII